MRRSTLAVAVLALVAALTPAAASASAAPAPKASGAAGSAAGSAAATTTPAADPSALAASGPQDALSPWAAAGARVTVVVDCGGQGRRSPHSYMLACADGNNYLADLDWSSWGGADATAFGLDVANDCDPYCAVGHFHSFPVMVRLDRPVAWKGHPNELRFTRLTMNYLDDRPTGSPATVTLPLPG